MPVQTPGMSIEGMDSKTALNQFLQRFCKRPVTKTDVVYTSEQLGPKNSAASCQATVKLNCYEGLEFAGEVSSNSKEAEKSAASQALEYFKDSGTLATLPPSASKQNKKRKSPGQAAPGAPAILGADGQPVAKAAKTGEVNEAANSAKSNLNIACMKIAKRSLNKGEIVYESFQTEGGHQSTVRMLCLPGEWAEQMCAGEVCETKKEAEQSAAAMALQALEADTAIAQDMHAPPKPKKPWTGKGSKGFNKGMMGKGMGMMMPSSNQTPLHGFGRQVAPQVIPPQAMGQMPAMNMGMGIIGAGPGMSGWGAGW